ncbi:hypothetical protein TNCV_1154011 [Trichonephila clavipes]|nr:hypothetical protein TNCV_1154011 [Trichonephila clavipes]
MIRIIVNFIKIFYPHSEEFGTVIEDDDDPKPSDDKSIYLKMRDLEELLLKRATDLAEALYSMPQNNQLSLPSPRSPALNNAATMSGFNAYTGQLAVNVQENGRDPWPHDCHCPGNHIA